MEMQELTRREEELSAEKQKSFHTFYIYLILGCAAVLVMGILLAVLVSVAVGAAVFVAGCGVYLFFLRDELRRRLSVGYRRGEDGWALTPVETGRDVLWIPCRLMWMEVTELFWEGSCPCAELKRLYVPTSVKRIEDGFFEGLPELECLSYLGTREQWEQVKTPPLPTGCQLWLRESEKEE